MEITRPTLLIDEIIVKKNIRNMVAKAERSGTELTPHFKTHQSRAVGLWFRDQGIKSITVSSVSMAQYFADDGWQKITIAFPLNILEIKEIATLASKIELTVLVTNKEQIMALQTYAEVYVKVLIEIDCGSHRSGLDRHDQLIADLILMLQHSQHQFQGFYSHFGHTYAAKSASEVGEIYHKSLKILTDLQLKYAYAKPTISLGDTPSCSIIDDFSRIVSLHAGNFVFYDLMQVQIGACDESCIGVVLACPVVSKDHERLEAIIYGGGVHLSKESMFDTDLSVSIYSKIVHLAENGWTKSIRGCYVKSISQEHGVVKLSAKAFNDLKIGDIIGVLPVHSCMTADVMGGYVDINGNIIDHM